MQDLESSFLTIYPQENIMVAFSQIYSRLQLICDGSFALFQCFSNLAILKMCGFQHPEFPSWLGNFESWSSHLLRFPTLRNTALFRSWKKSFTFWTGKREKVHWSFSYYKLGALDYTPRAWLQSRPWSWMWNHVCVSMGMVFQKTERKKKPVPRFIWFIAPPSQTGTSAS